MCFCSPCIFSAFVKSKKERRGGGRLRIQEKITEMQKRSETRRDEARRGEARPAALGSH